MILRWTVVVGALAIVTGCGRDAAAPTAPVVPVVEVDSRVSPDAGIAISEEPAEPAPATGGDPEQEILASIHEVSPDVRTITRRGLDLLLEHQGTILRARVVPDIVNGQTAGIRIYGVSPGSVLARLGFENGDRLETIGGHTLTDPTKALEAYAAMRHATTIPLGIHRRGHSRTLIIRIVD
jgi:hypothetical protein